MTSGKVEGALVALSLVVGCSPARIEVLIDPQPREVVRISVELSGAEATPALSFDAPRPGTGLRVGLPVTPGERIVTVRSWDANGNLVLEGRRSVSATSAAVGVCPIALAAVSAVSGRRAAPLHRDRE
jgi:hypothetical protein